MDQHAEGHLHESNDLETQFEERVYLPNNQAMGCYVSLCTLNITSVFFF